ncbi:MAG: hypothetical protein LBU51_00295, partial [Bacteroidales bacterium]|nr:hypothetical protein [Bacteroidales bacterium]
MKKIFLFISFLTLITPLFSQHDCYVVGYASDDSIHFYSKVWKNGEVLFSIKDGIHNIAPWNIIVTDSEDVYVSTIYNENASYVGDARVWKNGLELYTIAGAYARGLAIDGEDVYMSGGKYFYMGNAAAKVWKNGEELYSLSHSNIPAGVQNMCISDGNIYVVGWESKPPPGGTGPGIESARVWKNGEQLYDLSNNRSNAFSIFIDGDDVYVGGEEYLYSSVIYGSYVVARVWKNGEVLYTFSYPDLPDDSYAN